jgi:2'-5' RNA ligase
MAMIAIPLSTETSRLFREIDVSGYRDSSDHITLFYLGDRISIKTVLKIIPILYEVSSGIRPFEAQCSKITSFPKGDDGYPIIAELKSDILLEIRENIKTLLDKNKIKYDNTFPEYKPHITVSRDKNKPPKIKLPEKAKLPITQLALYGGDNANGRIFVSFPFSLGVEKQASDRALMFSSLFLTHTCYQRG